MQPEIIELRLLQMYLLPIQLRGAPRGVSDTSVNCRPTDRGSNPGLCTVYYFDLPRRNNNITRGIPLAPTKIISRG